MPIKVNCAGCGVLLTTPDSSAGKRAKCPKCGAVVHIPAAPAAEDDVLDAEPAPFGGLTEEELTSGPATQDERRPCPACGEMIMRDAVKCRFCGEIFDPLLRQQELKKLKQQTVAIEGDEMTTGDWVVAILCSGIGCIAGIVWMIQGKPKGKKMLLVSLVVQGFWVIVQVVARTLSEQR